MQGKAGSECWRTALTGSSQYPWTVDCQGEVLLDHKNQGEKQKQNPEGLQLGTTITRPKHQVGNGEEE